MAPSGIRWGWWKRADQSLRPFGFAQGLHSGRSTALRAEWLGLRRGLLWPE